MNKSRMFVITGGPSADDLIDRASLHGAPVRAVAHAAPSGAAVYGACEVVPLEHGPEREDGAR